MRPDVVMFVVGSLAVFFGLFMLPAGQAIMGAGLYVTIVARTVHVEIDRRQDR